MIFRKSMLHFSPRRQIILRKSMPQFSPRRQIIVRKSMPHFSPRRQISFCKSMPHCSRGRQIICRKSMPHFRREDTLSIASLCRTFRKSIASLQICGLKFRSTLANISNKYTKFLGNTHFYFRHILKGQAISGAKKWLIMLGRGGVKKRHELLQDPVPGVFRWRRGPSSISQQPDCRGESRRTEARKIAKILRCGLFLFSGDRKPSPGFEGCRSRRDRLGEKSPWKFVGLGWGMIWETRARAAARRAPRTPRARACPFLRVAHVSRS